MWTRYSIHLWESYSDVSLREEHRLLAGREFTTTRRKSWEAVTFQGEQQKKYPPPPPLHTFFCVINGGPWHRNERILRK